VFPLKNKDKPDHRHCTSGKLTIMKSNHLANGEQALLPSKSSRALSQLSGKPETTRLILTESIIDTATLLLIPEITNEYQLS
jgi:hypothetical protein